MPTVARVLGRSNVTIFREKKRANSFLFSSERFKSLAALFMSHPVLGYPSCELGRVNL